MCTCNASRIFRQFWTNEVFSFNSEGMDFFHDDIYNKVENMQRIRLEHTIARSKEILPHINQNCKSQFIFENKKDKIRVHKWYP